MRFTKMQGTGNDFVLIDARSLDRDWPALARVLCDRHFGVGSDGLLLVQSSSRADFRYRMFNPDGSESEACGNGLRCFAKYVIDTGLKGGQPRVSLETLAGIRVVEAEVERGRVRMVRVGMGVPVLTPADIPARVEPVDMSPVLDYPIEVGGRKLLVSLVSMGNPHAVAFLREPVSEFPLEQLGPKVEHHPLFPNRINFEVANVLTREQLEVRVWERGAGLTLSCGTGACAVAVAAWLKGLVDDRVEVTLPGGTLTIEWDGVGEVILCGPAEQVFTGEWPE